MTYRFVHANVHGRASALADALYPKRSLAVVVALNEAATLHPLVQRHPAWDSRRMGSNVLAWRRDRAECRQSWRREILPAGARWKASLAVLALLEVDGQPVLHGVTHFPSKAWTVWPWRRPAWFAAQAGLLAFVADVQRAHDLEGVPVMLSLDTNRGGDWDLPGFRTAAAPITFGRRGRYDRVFVQGPADLNEVEAVDVGSDHLAVSGLVRTITHKEPAMTSTPKTDALVAALRRRGVEVLTHDQWGSQHAATYRQRLSTRPHGLLPAKPVDTLWNHVTVTFDSGRLLGDFKADMRTIERIGMERFKSGFSYNFGVDANGDRPRIGLGQFLEAKGTHTVNDKKVSGFSRDQNAVALAVAWVGMPGNTLNKHALEAMVQLRGALIEVGALTTTYDDVPHSLVADKDCPTDELRNRLPELKRLGLAAVKPRAAKPTRVQNARDLLDAAHARAVKLGHTKRAAAIKAARDLLPKR